MSADQIKVLNSQTDVEADSFEEAFPPARSRLKLMDLCIGVIDKSLCRL